MSTYESHGDLPFLSLQALFSLSVLLVMLLVMKANLLLPQMRLLAGAMSAAHDAAQQSQPRATGWDVMLSG